MFSLDLGLNENTDIKLYTHKGYLIEDDKDIKRITNNAMVFITIGGILLIIINR